MSEQKKENGKLKLTGFQRMCLEHALGVDYEYEEYEDRGRLTAEQCEDAHSWIWDKLRIPYGAEEKWKPITITIPADMIEAVWYVLDNARDASVMLADGDMYENMRHENGTGDNMSEGLADSIIDRTSYAIWVKLEALKELI